MISKRQKIVVMGGSFNPPTLAHYKLMSKAIDLLDADIGYFVPVSDAYLRRKMLHSHPPVVLSVETRIAMLQTICDRDTRLQVCEKERDTIEARTLPTMVELQEEHPDADLYFILGDDKLKLLSHLTEARRFLDLFQVVLVSREDTTLIQTLQQHDTLSNYLNRITVMAAPEGISHISSTVIRKRMLAGESSEDMLCPEVWKQFSRFTAADFPDVISRFKNEYDFLSNRFSCQFTWQGLRYGNVEAAFQSSKCREEEGRKVFANCSADKAAMKGKALTPPPEWEQEKLAIMESILEAKFSQNPALMEKLKATGNSILLNGNSKKEEFWGVDLYKWTGENHLGKIIMNIRRKEKEK